MTSRSTLSPLEFPFHDLGHLDVAAVEIDGAVARDRVAVDGENDVAGFQDPSGRTAPVDAADHDALAVVGQAERVPGAEL